MIEGLYQYDALARLRQASLERAGISEGSKKGRRALPSEDLGRYVKLGPVGTAFLASERPRVVLIDEIDKSDVDLPNDLLHVLENGEFEIPELVRIADQAPVVEVTVSDSGSARQEIKGGRVRCSEFPFIVITSNGERDLPPAFLRRCLRIDLPNPKPAELREIVEKHFGKADLKKLDRLLAQFDERRKQGMVLATDQLLNAFYLLTRGNALATEEREFVERILLRELDAR